MERLELVGLDWGLVLVQVAEWVLGTVVVSIIVGINGLGLEAGNGIEFLNRGSTETGKCTEDRTLNLRNFRILNRIDEGILRLGGVVLELLGSVLFAEWSDLVKVHFQIMSHFLCELILWCRIATHTTGNDRYNEETEQLHLGIEQAVLDVMRLTSP